MILLLFSNIIPWLERHMLICPSKKYLHLECPGCGFQRSFLALLKGDLSSSLTLYPATIPIFIMLIFTALHIKYKFLYGATFLKYFQIAIASVIMVFYIYKIIHLKTTD